MDLIKCPDCSNLINPKSEGCPICGCNWRTRRVRRVVKWLALVLAVGWLANHFLHVV
jgi:hypothetical protein